MSATVIWFTGLSGAGKTTLAEALKKELGRYGARSVVLDGDAVRNSRERPLDFSRDHILQNGRHVIELCEVERESHDYVLVAVIAPFSRTRREARHRLGPGYFEVHVDTSVEVCAERDTKGLYRNAQEGIEQNLIGVSPKAPYEIPREPDLVLDTADITIEASAERLIQSLRSWESLRSIRRTNQYVERPLFIEGFTRAGKFLLGNLLSTLDKVDQYQYLGLLEHLPTLIRQHLVPRETGIGLIQTLIDTASYDLAIGRNLNFRPSDRSFVGNSAKASELRQRVQRSSPAPETESRFFPFILHECGPYLGLYLELYPDARVIRLERSPMTLMGSWMKRGWGERWGVDPADLSICIQGTAGPVPTHAIHIKGYQRLEPVNRVIASLLSVARHSTREFDSLSEDEQQRILAVRYEDLCLTPLDVLERAAKFLGAEVSGADSLVEREGLPSTPVSHDATHEGADPALLSQLTDLERFYQENGTLVGWDGD
jgi:adenylyl-sulfate kinase